MNIITTPQSAFINQPVGSSIVNVKSFDSIGWTSEQPTIQPARFCSSNSTKLASTDDLAVTTSHSTRCAWMAKWHETGFKSQFLVREPVSILLLCMLEINFLDTQQGVVMSSIVSDCRWNVKTAAPKCHQGWESIKIKHGNVRQWGTLANLLIWVVAPSGECLRGKGKCCVFAA